MRTLSYEQARRTYDRIGALQDSQAFYEDRTTAELLEHGRFETAADVFELGCGTGRFGQALLERLPADATYRGVDLSPTMVHLARARLAPFGSRAEVTLTEGGPAIPRPDASCDRWVSNFVLDLLSGQDIEAVLAEAHRMLRPGGLLCVASLSTGTTALSRAVAFAWSAIHRVSPRIVGGCRPLAVGSYLPRSRWEMRHHAALAPYGIPSEAFVAGRV